MGIALNFSTVYHPHIDGQTQVVNQSIGDLLRCLVGEHLTIWDMVLLMTEFAHNSSVNRYIGLNLLEIVSDYKHRKPINLLSFPIGDRPSGSTE